MKAITDPDPEKAINLDSAATFKRLMKKTRVISLTASLGSIAVFGIGGYCLDLALDKRNFCTIIGLVVGFVVMNILSVIMCKRMWERERSAAGRV